jgi:hypothetical protein
MLWLSTIPTGVPSNLQSPSRVDADGPYPFSVYVDGEARLLNANRYDFLVEGVETGHYLELGVLSGRLHSIHGIGVGKGECVAYDAPYSEVGEESPEAALFTLLPIAGGDAPQVGNSSVKQNTDISISLYSDAVVVLFDRFSIAKRFRIAEGVEAGTSADGLLAALIFRDHLVEPIKRIIAARPA